MKLLRRKEVEERTGLSRSSIYLAMSQKAFPRPLRVRARAVRWQGGRPRCMGRLHAQPRRPVLKQGALPGRADQILTVTQAH